MIGRYLRQCISRLMALPDRNLRYTKWLNLRQLTGPIRPRDGLRLLGFRAENDPKRSPPAINPASQQSGAGAILLVASTGGQCAVKRREFITLLGGAVAAWPLAARAQQSGAPVIGFLRSQSLSGSSYVVPAFLHGLKEAGFTEGQNVSIEFRYADNQVGLLPALARELIDRQAAAVVANVLGALAVKQASATIPIVFVTGSDPVSDGLVTSLNRPGANVTGISFISGALGAKRFEMLRQLVPPGTTIAMLAEVDTEEAAAERKEVEAAAERIGQQLAVYAVTGVADFEPAFASILQRRAGALLIGAGPMLTSHREEVVALAARHALPAFYSLREFPAVGGLMSYGASITDAYRQAGVYAGRILKGQSPGDLPVMQATKFEFVINLNTAKMLGVTIPPTLLALADEVIE
jgi:putative ABC transport system substrate-binding protein